jgi:hypothetical protein
MAGADSPFIPALTALLTSTRWAESPMNIPVRIGMDTSKPMLQLHGVDENEDVGVRRQCRQAPDEAVPGSTPARGTKNDEAPAPGMMPALTRSHRACRKIDGDREDAAQRQGRMRAGECNAPSSEGLPGSRNMPHAATSWSPTVSSRCTSAAACSCLSQRRRTERSYRDESTTGRFRRSVGTLSRRLIDWRPASVCVRNMPIVIPRTD